MPDASPSANDSAHAVRWYVWSRTECVMRRLSRLQLDARSQLATGLVLAPFAIMPASTEAFIARVASRAGVGVDCAERATRVVLSGIGTCLGPVQRELVAEELPAALGAAVLATNSLATPLNEHVFVRSVTAGHARELIASACRVLAEELSFEAIDAIRAAVPPTIAILFGPPGSVTTRASSTCEGRGESRSVRAHTSIAATNRGSTCEIAMARVATAGR